MDKELKKQLEKDLNKTLYNKIDEINILDEITTDTDELANILDDYLTENIEVNSNTETIDEIEFIENKEITIDVDENELLQNYDNNLKKIGHETLNNLLDEDEEIYDDIEKAKNFHQEEELGTKTANIEEILEQFEVLEGNENKKEIESGEHTQNLITSEFIDIENIDDIFVEQENENNEQQIDEIKKKQQEFEKEEKFSKIDILLFVLIVILSLLLIWMILK